MIKRARTKRTLSKRSQSGFSLAEFAVVVGVISIIISGIWALADELKQNTAQERLSEQLSIVAKNVRAAYLGKPFIDSTYTSQVMQNLTAMNAFPGDMVRLDTNTGAYVVDSPFGPTINPKLNGSPYNSLYICGWRSSGSTGCDMTFAASTVNVPLLAIEVLLPAGAPCAKAVMRNTGSTGIIGLVDVVINGQKAVFLGNSLPPPPTFVAQNCTPFNASSPSVVVDFVIRPNPSGP